MELDNQSGNHFSRSRNVGRNMIFGNINRCVFLLLPFIVRTVVIYRFGALYFGVTAVLAVACLAACNRVGLPCIEAGHDALQAATGAAKVAEVNAVNGASASATSGVAAAGAAGIVNGVANPGQSKFFALAGLAARLLLCTVIVVAGYYLSYRWTERYREAKEWLWSRYRGMRREG